MYCNVRCYAKDFDAVYHRKEGESDREYNRNRRRAYYANSESFRENVKKHNQKFLEKKTSNK